MDARRTDTWVFVSLPAAESEEIRDLPGGLRRGFGSQRVLATIGNSTWRTSIFPGSGTGYVLPVKRSIRLAEALGVGDLSDCDRAAHRFRLTSTRGALVLSARTRAS
jgi:hypothetical protein